MRDRRTGLFSAGGIDEEFTAQGREFTRRIGIKGTLFHYVYGFRSDEDGVRRFHHRRPQDSIDDYEAVKFEGIVEIEVVPGRAMFTTNQVLNKQNRVLDTLSARERA